MRRLRKASTGSSARSVAQALRLRGDHDPRYEAFLSCARVDYPRDPVLLMLEADALVAEHPDQALRTVRKAVRLAGSDGRVLTDAALKLYRLGRLAECADVVALASEHDLDYPESVPYLLNLRGKLSWSAGTQLAAAEQALRDAADLEPSAVAFACDLILFLAEHDRRDEADDLLTAVDPSFEDHSAVIETRRRLARRS